MANAFIPRLVTLANIAMASASIAVIPAGASKPISSSCHTDSGNLSTRTDSRGVQASYSYDALDRLSAVSFTLSGQSTQAYAWTYDQTGAGFSSSIGRLSTASFPEGNTQFSYDPQGRVLQSRQTVNGAPETNAQAVQLNTSYSYDAAGQITGVVYPSGRSVNISITAGLPSGLSLSTTAGAVPSPMLSNIQFAPFGAVQSWNWQMSGGTLPYSRSFDSCEIGVRRQLNPYQNLLPLCPSANSLLNP